VNADPDLGDQLNADPDLDPKHCKPGLWIRIDLIRIQAKTELLKTISFSNFLKSKFESNQIKNTGVTGTGIHQNFFQKVFMPF
jgi:hypothetical protein